MAEDACSEFDAVAAEVALGVADAQEQSAAMVHLAHCPRCRSRLGQLSGVADGLLSLAPPAEPPAGFESRLLASLAAARVQTSGIAPRPAAPQPLRPRRPTRHRLVQLAAAVAAAALLAAGGWVAANRSSGGSASPSSSATASGQVVTATLLAGDRPVGEVVLQTGRDSWISMAVEAAPADLAGTTVTCRLRTRGGRAVVIGSFPLAGGYGYWAAPVPTSSPVTAAQLVGAGGRVVASAVLSPARR